MDITALYNQLVKMRSELDDLIDEAEQTLTRKEWDALAKAFEAIEKVSVSVYERWPEYQNRASANSAKREYLP